MSEQIPNYHLRLNHPLREAISRLRKLELSVMASLPSHLQLEFTDSINALLDALRENHED